MTENISVYLGGDGHCNSCHAVNYESSVMPHADELCEIRIGHNVIVLCPECAMKLAHKIMDSIDGDYKSTVEFMERFAREA